MRLSARSNVQWDLWGSVSVGPSEVVLSESFVEACSDGYC